MDNQELGYQPEDLELARSLYARGYVLNEPTEANIIECAKAYYNLRINSWAYLNSH